MSAETMSAEIMINHKLAKIFYEMSGFLKKKKVRFKPRAYENAARSVLVLSENIDDIYRKAGIPGLLKIPAVGQGISLKIEEYIKTGKIKDYEKLKKKMPVKLGEDFLLDDIPVPAKDKNILKESDIKGDLQAHTDWTDGGQTIPKLAASAGDMGYEYVLVTDHTKSLAMTGGLDEHGLLRQMEAIDKVNRKFQIPNSKFQILKGAEVNIMKDGTLDINNETLEKLDIAGASVHSHFHLPKKEQTGRVIKAMENPHVDIIFHPTGRLMGRRPEIELNMEEIFRAAKRTGTILEINAFPDRLDLKDEYIRRARELGVKFSIGTDAHDKSHLPFMKYGVWQARRAGCQKSDIVNTVPTLKLLELFRKPKTQRFF